MLKPSLLLGLCLVSVVWGTATPPQTAQAQEQEGVTVNIAQRPPENDESLETPEPAFREQTTEVAPGVRLRQEYVSFGRERFPVVALEVDPRHSGVQLRPIWGEPPSMTGTEPLVTMGRRWRVLAAINGGFFNRDNRLPLGAIRRDSQWFSGPILNRGAMGWDNQGNVKIDRLYLREVLTTSTGRRVFISHLNSGYVQAGVARYTPAWGRSYTPLTDNETLLLVRNNQITRRLSGEAASRFPIPEDGYILAVRANSVSPRQLPVGTRVQLTSETIPDDFVNYPHIIGAGPLLLRNGGIVLNGAAEKFSNAFNRQTASRSAIGTTSQGTLILAAVHNRVGGKGPNLRELAQVLQRLGVVNALNLDGGSSTSLYLHNRLIDRPASTAARVHNAIGIYVRQD